MLRPGPAADAAGREPPPVHPPVLAAARGVRGGHRRRRDGSRPLPLSDVRRPARVLPARRLGGRPAVHRDLRLHGPADARLCARPRHRPAADQYRQGYRHRPGARADLPSARGSRAIWLHRRGSARGGGVGAGAEPAGVRVPARGRVLRKGRARTAAGRPPPDGGGAHHGGDLPRDPRADRAIRIPGVRREDPGAAPAAGGDCRDPLGARDVRGTLDRCPSTSSSSAEGLPA